MRVDIEAAGRWIKLKYVIDNEVFEACGKVIMLDHISIVLQFISPGGPTVKIPQSAARSWSFVGGFIR